MKKLYITLGVLMFFIVSVTALNSLKEINLEPPKKTALLNIGIDNTTITHNCEVGKNSCKALLFKQTQEEVYDEENNNYTTIYTTVLNKEIEIDTSERFCIKEGLDEFKETICVEYRGLTLEEIDEEIRKEVEEKLGQIAEVLIKRNNTQPESLDNKMEMTIV